jgi:hypothetical protein
MKVFAPLFSLETKTFGHLIQDTSIVVWHFIYYQTCDSSEHVVIYISGGSELLLIQLERLASLLKTVCGKI